MDVYVDIRNTRCDPVTRLECVKKTKHSDTRWKPQEIVQPNLSILQTQYDSARLFDRC